MSNDKVVLLTGIGIGAAASQHLASIGYRRLCLVARREDQLREVADACKRAGARDVLVLAKDLTMREQCREVVEEAGAVAAKSHLSTCCGGTFRRCSSPGSQRGRLRRSRT